MNDFVHLHCHSRMSFLDGTASVEGLANRAHAFGHPAVAVTDANNLCGSVAFTKACKAEKIRPIYGAEVWVWPPGIDAPSLGEAGPDVPDGGWQLVLLCRDGAGWKNLCALLTIAHRNMHYRPRIDLDTLALHAEGLICLTSGLCGPLMRAGLPVSAQVRSKKASGKGKKGSKTSPADGPDPTAALFAALPAIDAPGMIEDIGLRDAALGRLRDVFADRLWFEVVDHGLPMQAELCRRARELAPKFGVRVVATNECRTLEAKEVPLLETLHAIALGTAVDDDGPHRVNTDQAWLKPRSEMAEIFPAEELDASLEVAEQCRHVLELGKVYLPASDPPAQMDGAEGWRWLSERFVPPKDFGELVDPRAAGPGSHSHSLSQSDRSEPQASSKHPPAGPQPSDGGVASITDRYFEAYCRRGLELHRPAVERRSRNKPWNVYEERLEFELRMIQKMGFPAYLLIVAEFIGWAKDHRVPTGPGRGSAAGSLCAWAMRITDVDPIRFDLLFERFLNPSRVSMPDIDSDFGEQRRELVIDHVREKYGAQSVGFILTFNAMKDRQAIRDVARVLSITHGDADYVAKKIGEDDTAKDGAKKAGEAIALGRTSLHALVAGDPKWRRAFELAGQICGAPRQTSIHAAGIVIASQPLETFLPFHYDAKSGRDVVGTDLKGAETLGLVKFDFLGLKNLDIVEEALDRIEARTGARPDLYESDFEDPAVFEALSRGDTLGVFQLGSHGIRDLVKRLEPSSMEDIISVLALYRPGPLGSGMVDDFVERRHGRQAIAYPHPALESVLKNTYGVIVYQEQCVAEGSPVWTQHGPVPIEEIEVGDLVWTTKGYRAVTAKKDKGLQACKKIETSAGYLTLTNEHPVRVRKKQEVWRGDTRREEEEVWVEAGKLTDESLVRAPDVQQPTWRLERNDDLLMEAWRAGYCVGNSCVDTSVCIAVSDSEERARIVGKKFDTWGKICVFFNTRCWYVRITDPETRPMPRIAGVHNARPIIKMDRWGIWQKRAHEKTTPKWILQSGDVTVLAAYLLGLMDSDGHVPQDDSKRPIHYTSVSARLLDEVQWIAWNCGIHGRRRENRIYMDDLSLLTPVAEHIGALKDYGTQDRWMAEINVFASRDIKHLEVGKRKKSQFTTARVLTRRGHGRESVVGLPVYARVQESQDNGIHRVWDIEVEEANEFVIEGHVVHNCMMVARDLAGFDLANADLLRRAMGKKLPAEMAAQRGKFVEGCEKNGTGEEKANEVFDLLDYFSGYGFNRSHSCSYAFITYFTSWLKVHHTADFLASCMTWCGVDDEELRAQYARDVLQHGIAVRPPDLDRSGVRFEVEQDEDGTEAVRWSLLGVKGVGQSAAAIVAERRKAPFGELQETVLRLSALDKTAWSALADAGALDRFGPRRDEIKVEIERIRTGVAKGKIVAEQGSLFGAAPPPRTERAGQSWRERLSAEKASIGLWLSGHPLDAWPDVRERLPSRTLATLDAKTRIREAVSVIGVVSTLHIIRTRRGDAIGFVGLADEEREIEVTCMPEAWNRYKHLLVKDEAVLVEGTFDRPGEDRRLVVDKVEPLSELRNRWCKTLQIALEADEATDDRLDRIAAVLAKHPGRVPVLVRLKNALDGYGWRADLWLPKERSVRPCAELYDELEGAVGEPARVTLPGTASA